MSNTKVRFSKHAIQRCFESGVSWKSLAREVSGLNFTGKIRWMTKYGTLVLEKIANGTVLVKTFIAKYKYKNINYNKGCNTY